MLVIVDVNEEATNPTMVNRLRQFYPDLIVANLEYGDVNVILDDGSVFAIERKNAHDFLGSIADGRLFDQIERMSAAKYSAVLVLGHIAYDKDDMVVVNGERTNWRGSSVRGAIYACGYSACPVIFYTEEGYGFAVDELVQFVKKPDQHWQRKHRRIVTFPPVDDTIDIIASFPNIGLKRANSLAEWVGKNGECGSLAEMLSWASCFPLINAGSRPFGWGNKVVENFRSTLGLKPNEYLIIKEEENASK